MCGFHYRYPVLLAVDDFQALFCRTTYRDQFFTPIQPYHLSVPRLILEFASGRRAFVSTLTLPSEPQLFYFRILYREKAHFSVPLPPHLQPILLPSTSKKPCPFLPSVHHRVRTTRLALRCYESTQKDCRLYLCLTN